MRITFSGFKQARFYYQTLLITDRQTPLQLFTHAGIVGLEARRQASKTDIMESAQTVTGSARCAGRSSGCRATSDGTGVEIKFPWSVSGGWL